MISIRHTQLRLSSQDLMWSIKSTSSSPLIIFSWVIISSVSVNMVRLIEYVIMSNQIKINKKKRDLKDPICIQSVDLMQILTTDPPSVMMEMYKSVSKRNIRCKMITSKKKEIGTISSVVEGNRVYLRYKQDKQVENEMQITEVKGL